MLPHSRLPRASSAAQLARLSIACLLGCSTLGGCSSVSNALSPDKVDYKSASTSRSAPLDIPPDLTQLTNESRYQTTSGAVSALQQTTTLSALPGTPAVAVRALGGMRIERSGNQRWLATNLPAEQAWSALKTFWKDQGFALAVDNAPAGVMETEWSENRAKLPNDAVRNTLGRLIDTLYDTGERDRFRTRIEDVGSGTEIYISHHGLAEVYTSPRDDQTAWQVRPNDPSLEAEFLSRLMVSLGATSEQAKTAVATPAVLAVKARLLQTGGVTLSVDDNFDRAWRRVGLALDRTGFTVEDRDRSQGLYYVRYADASQDASKAGSWWSRVFSSKKSEPTLARYRVSVRPTGVSGAANCTVVVLNEQGRPEVNETSQRIARVLLDELK